MPKAEPTLDFIQVWPDQRSLQRFAQMVRSKYERLASLVSGRLRFGDGVSPDNLDGVWASPVTPGVANTDFTVTHNLQRIPVGYIVMSKSAACDVYTGSVVATVTQLTLRATVVGVTLKLFIV